MDIAVIEEVASVGQYRFVQLAVVSTRDGFTAEVNQRTIGSPIVVGEGYGRPDVHGRVAEIDDVTAASPINGMGIQGSELIHPDPGSSQLFGHYGVHRGPSAVPDQVDRRFT
jgi:hypothetical protein